MHHQSVDQRRFSGFALLAEVRTQRHQPSQPLAVIVRQSVRP